MWNNAIQTGRGFLQFIFLFILVACSHGKPQDLEDFVKQIKQTASDRAKNVHKPVPSLPKPIIYQAAHLRSPFNMTGVLTDSVKLADSPLQAYPVNVLKLVGTITRGSITFAYVMTPDQMVYEVNEGDFLGDRHGKVMSIEPGRVSIMEQEREEGKTSIQHLVTLELKDEQ